MEERGLRRCTQRDCKIPLNRDKNGAINTGINFQRLTIPPHTLALSDGPPPTVECVSLKGLEGFVKLAADGVRAFDKLLKT